MSVSIPNTIFDVTDLKLCFSIFALLFTVNTRLGCRLQTRLLILWLLLLLISNQETSSVLLDYLIQKKMKTRVGLSQHGFLRQN